MQDIYQQVTDKIIAELETGSAPWVRPWTASNGGALPFNASTGKRYRGINTALLMGTACHYGASGFVTFKQALDLGGNVRKGETGHKIIFWNMRDLTTDTQTAGDDSSEETRRVAFAKGYTVFNVAQCDGLNLKPAPVVAPINTDTRNDQLDVMTGNTGATIRHQGDIPCYRPSPDDICMPAFERFRSASNYYATLFHELTHWTGNKKRLARDLLNRFGSEAYAAEELIAEMGAAFLCAEHGVTGQLQHAEYLKNWLQVLRNDKRAIFTAASKAQAAADYLNAAMSQPLAIAA